MILLALGVRILHLLVPLVGSHLLGEEPLELGQVEPALWIVAQAVVAAYGPEQHVRVNSGLVQGLRNLLPDALGTGRVAGGGHPRLVELGLALPAEHPGVADGAL